MRIIGGLYRHRLIDYPEDRPEIRPTKDRIREAIFNITGDITSYEVLDLYAGSGSMGLEAISRGAKHVDFVDVSPLSKKVVLANLSHLGISSSFYDFHFVPDFTALETFRNENKQFDLIFLDPPYRLGQYEKLVEEIIGKNLLKEHGIIICESNRKIDISSSLPFRVREYQYGEILVTTLRK